MIAFAFCQSGTLLHFHRLRPRALLCPSFSNEKNTFLCVPLIRNRKHKSPLRRFCLAKDQALEIIATSPLVPSTRTKSPSFMSSVALDVSMMVGMPYSLATVAAGAGTPPVSVTNAISFRKKGTSSRDTEGHTRMVLPSITLRAPRALTTVARPSATPIEAACPLMSLPSLSILLLIVIRNWSSEAAPEGLKPPLPPP